MFLLAILMDACFKMGFLLGQNNFLHRRNGKLGRRASDFFSQSYKLYLK